MCCLHASVKVFAGYWRTFKTSGFVSLLMPLSFRSRSQYWTTPVSGSRFQNVVKAHPGRISSFCRAFIGYARASRKRVFRINNANLYYIIDARKGQNWRCPKRTVLCMWRDDDNCNATDCCLRSTETLIHYIILYTYTVKVLYIFDTTSILFQTFPVSRLSCSTTERKKNVAQSEFSRNKFW